MTGLLVSVRTVHEARLAVEAGVDLVDVKEPRNGSLGGASPELIAQIANCVAKRVPVSAALGELVDFVPLAVHHFAGVDFLKLGLAGCAARADWPQLWMRAWESLPAGCGRIAVAYADWRSADSPTPEAVFDEAQAAGCTGLLFDTYDKRGGDLFSRTSDDELLRIGARARRAGLLYVLAGGLRGPNVRRARDLQPDYVAVRGAVCAGDRDGPVDKELLRELTREFRNAPASAEPLDAADLGSQPQRSETTPHSRLAFGTIRADVIAGGEDAAR